jgi:hypothetical protein
MLLPQIKKPLQRQSRPLEADRPMRQWAEVRGSRAELESKARLMPFAPMVNEPMLMAVGQAMRDHTGNFITPICRAIEFTYGEVEGSGTFVELHGATYIITNEHVARARLSHPLAHFIGNGMRVARIVYPFQCLTWPTDAALARVDAKVLSGGTEVAIPSSRIYAVHRPVDGEIMFIHGFPGGQSHFSATYQGLLARTCPYATDIPPLPPGYDLDLHFALSYPAHGNVKTFQRTPTTLPDPPGLSGTVVWDTRFVATGGSWSPDKAVISGIVFGWNPGHQCLVATRIEIARIFLLQALREEAASFDWLNRGQPLWDDLADWTLAEQTIRGID